MADLEIRLPETVKRARAAEEDTDVHELLRLAPAQIDAMIEARVTDFASAKAMIKVLAKSLAALSRVEG